MKLSSVSKSSLLLSIFFGVNTIVSLFRQVIIARTFGLSKELDAFNAANNIPDLLFSLISGGALAFALIPVLSEFLTHHGKEKMWKIFSHILNLVFIVTAVMSVIVAVFAESIVKAEFGVAPGFDLAQQNVVITLMRLNLIATMIFSVSGIISSGLQARQHFLAPAVAPLFYNLGLIVGAIVFSQWFGVIGLVYGTILGALLHLLIQIPVLPRLGYKWYKGIGIKTEGVRKVLALMGPRLLTVFLIQVIFLGRDNLASRLDEGSVSALTYGWTFMQVPETLIGTAIGTAVLPTLSELVAKKNKEAFQTLISRTVRVVVALSLGATAIAFFTLNPIIEAIFSFEPQQTMLLTSVAKAFIIGLLGHTLLEIFTRTFYSKQDARTPLYGTAIRVFLFFLVAILTYRTFGVVGIAIADSISVTLEVLFMFILLKRRGYKVAIPQRDIVRITLAIVVTAGTVWLVMMIPSVHPLVKSILGLILGTGIFVYFIRPELKTLLRL
jgi:putative peptidoglycan lipid II flippase